MRDWLVAACGVALLVVVIAPIGPVKVAYVYSDSMEPALNVNDGIILVSGEIHEGDIITYRSPDENAYVTHRVVDTTAEGFITKGDANPSTDQAAGAPPIENSQVVGKALTYDGSPVTIPLIGLFPETVSENPLLTSVVITMGGGLTFAISQWRQHSARTSPATPMRAGEVINTAFAVAIITLLVLSHFGASTQTLTFSATEDGQTDGDTIAAHNETVKTLPFNVSASGSGHYAVHASGMHVQNQSLNESTLLVTARVQPPGATGEVRRTVRIYHYPSVLPAPVVTRLDRVHPLVGVTASVLAVFGPLYLLARLLLDSKRPIHPPRSKRGKTIHELLT